MYQKKLDYHNFPDSMATIGGIPWHTHPFQTPKSLSIADGPWFLLEKLGYRDFFPNKTSCLGDFLDTFW